jgi:hypothetical protein
MPRIVPRSGTRKSVRRIAPSIACVAAGAAAPEIQKPLASCIEAKESQNHSLLCCSHTLIAADQFVVRHAAVGQDHGAPRLDPHMRAEWKARPEHHRVEQVAFESYVGGHRAIVERARQRRYEIDSAGRPALDEAAAWNLDDHVHLGPPGPPFTVDGPIVARVFHCASLPQSGRLGMTGILATKCAEPCCCPVNGRLRSRISPRSCGRSRSLRRAFEPHRPRPV